MFDPVQASREATVAAALAEAGRDERLRSAVFDALRRAEAEADNPAAYRHTTRRPLVLGLLSQVSFHRVVLNNGLIFEVSPDSRIEEALLLSSEAHPDHIWEPQTTKLLVALSNDASHIIVGGAYIGDHVLPMARAISAHTSLGLVHAFEPMEPAYQRLVHHLEINAVDNVVAYRLGLWDQSDAMLELKGPAALASSELAEEGGESSNETVQSVAIDDYVKTKQLPSVELIMLDTEGGEERALLGAQEILSRPSEQAPNLVFEVHRSYVDWTNGLQNTSVVRLLSSNGYTVFAIRDFHDNYPMADKVVEIVPVDCVYLEGPPHGFNLLATKDSDLVERLGLRVVPNVSPKLLPDKDPALHHPLDGLR